MKVTQRDGSAERQVLIGMVISKKVLGAISQRWKHEGLFSSKHANLAANWAVEFFKKYNRPPEWAGLEVFYHEWADTHPDPETVRAVGSLLQGLSAETERLKSQLNQNHLIDIAGKLFESIRLKDLMLQVGASLERNDVEQARSLIEKSRKIELGLGAEINLLTDKPALARAFERKQESLITLPGAMGNFYGNCLCRGGFVAVCAHSKRGKSFDLQDLAWRAIEQGRKVAYFEMGDHSEEDVVIRFATRATGLPYDPQQKHKTMRVELPTQLDTESGEVTAHNIRWEDRKVLTLDRAWRFYEEIVSDGDGDRMKLWCNSAGSMSIKGVDLILEEKARDGWLADIVVLDYLDLAAPLDTKGEKLEQENETWMLARGLSQKRHALVLAATQANRKNPDAKTLTREDIGGFHMKLAHVTRMSGICQTPKEKQQNISRRNWIGGRDLEFGEKKICYYAGNLAIGQPMLMSSF